MGHDDICVMGKLRKETFGGRSYRLPMWVGGDFRDLGTLLCKQLDPLTRSGHSCTGPLGTTLMWMAFGRGTENIGRTRGAHKPELDMSRPHRSPKGGDLVKESQREQLGGGGKHWRILQLPLHNSTPLPRACGI